MSFVAFFTTVLGPAGFFLRFAAAGALFVVAAWALRRTRPAVRDWGQVGASLALIAALTTAQVASLMAVYALVFFGAVEGLGRGRVRSAAIVALLVLQVLGPILWLPRLPGYDFPVREFVAFGTNMTLLRCWSYAWDRSRRPDPVPPTLREYAAFMFFFPAFVNGPLVSVGDFRRRRRPWYWGEEREVSWTRVWHEERVAFLRAGLGLAVALLAMLLVCRPGIAAYEAAVAGDGAAAWLHAVRVYLCWYLSFTAWTEAAIGLGRLAGVSLPENFDAPHLAYGPADFWRRWNITLQIWLRNYVYLPLGGAYPRRRSGERRPEWRNTAAVFVFMVVYHVVGGLKYLGPALYPASSVLPWLLWAALNSAAVLATRRLKRPARVGVVTLAVIVLTFAFSCIGHTTAQFPPGIDLRRLVDLYQRLLFL